MDTIEYEYDEKLVVPLGLLVKTFVRNKLGDDHEISTGSYRLENEPEDYYGI